MTPSPRCLARRLATAAGGELAVYLWPTAGPPRASLTICHGYLEHAGRHAALAAAAAAAGIQTRTFDLRGHGRSTGRRAGVGHMGEYLADLRAVVADAPAGRPHFWLGHSLGGLIALSAALAGPAPAALVLINPFLRLARGRRGLLAALGPAVGRLWPGLRVAAGIASEALTSDPEEIAAHKNDPAILTHATAGWATAVSAGQAALDKNPLTLACPVLWVVGEADAVADPAASEAAFARLQAPHKTLWRRPGERHEVLHERGRVALVGEVIGWLMALEA